MLPAKMPRIQWFFLAALCLVNPYARPAHAQPEYVRCDRTIDRNACSGIDVRSCTRIMQVTPNHLPLGSTDLYAFPSCVLPDEDYTFALGTGVVVFHADAGSVPGDDCTDSNVKKNSDSGVGTVVWTSPPAATHSVTMLLADTFGFGATVTTQESEVDVTPTCPTPAPTSSPSAFPTTFPVVTPEPTDEPTSSPVVPSAAPTAAPSSAVTNVQSWVLLLCVLGSVMLL